MQGVTSQSSIASGTSLAPSQTLLTKVTISPTDENKELVLSGLMRFMENLVQMEQHPGKLVQTCLLMH